MQRSFGKSRLAHASFTLATASLFAASPALTFAADSLQDFVLSPAPGVAAAQRSPAVSKFKFMFAAPARWQGTLHWRYNHANAPGQFSNVGSPGTELEFAL